MFTEYAETGEYELYDLNADPYQLAEQTPSGQRATLLHPGEPPQRP